LKPIFVRAATEADALSVAQRLREEDRAEVLAAAGIDPRIILPAQVREGREIKAAGIAGGLAEVLFGCDPMTGDPSVGIIWMLSTPAIYKHPIEFVATSKRIIGDYRDRFEILTNFVDARNERHIRWLKRLGFHMLRRVETFGAQSLPFIEFASFRECV
jgi:hypothetical protein